MIAAARPTLPLAPLEHSAALAALVMVLATPLAALGAIGLWHLPRAVAAPLLLPVLIPHAWLAEGLHHFAEHAGIAETSLLLVLGHVWLAAPLAGLVILAGLRRIDELGLRAARANGAGPFAVWRRLILPAIAPWLGSAAMLSLIVSLTEGRLALRLAAPGQTTLAGMLAALDPGDAGFAPLALGLAALCLLPLLAAALMWVPSGR